MAFYPYYPDSIRISPPFPEYRSSTWAIGSLVYVNAGYLTICGGDPAAIMGVTFRAGQNGGSDGTYSSSVYLASPEAVFIAPSNTTTAVTHVGGAYGVVLSGSDWLVDISEGSNTRLKIIGLFPGDAVGASGGRYLIAFLPANCQGY